MKNIAIIILLLVSKIAIAQTDIQLHPIPGFVMHANSNAIVKINMMGMNIDMKTIHFITATVKSVKQTGESDWEFIVDSMIIDSKQGDEISYINTNNKATTKDAPAELVDVVGKKILATVDNYGRVTMEKDGPESMIVKACFIEYAGQAITASQNWKIENQINVMGKNINMSTTYIIKTQDDNTYTVQATAAAKVELLGKIPANSSYVIDKKTGLILSSTTKMEINTMGEISTNATYLATW